MTNVHSAFGAVLNAATTLSGKTQANEIANHPLGRTWAWCTSSAMSTDVAVDVNAGVALITLNRPEHLNAYTAEMGALLSAAYRDCDNDDNVRAIVVTGAGRAFCAGADFSGISSPFDSPPDDSAFSASPIDPAAFELRKPVIAAVNGHAIGIGLTIALQADMRIVADDAKYGVVQVRRGVMPDCMSHWTLAQLTNLGVAAEVLLTGRSFSGGEAVGWGIANRALPAAEVLDLAMDIARDIATNVAPMSAALCKRLLWDTAINGYTPRQVASLETQLHHRVMGTDDAREGVTAFLERRSPRFSARLSADWTPLPEPEL
jgi:enoyl-CoA hydratase/carnithine racemase